MTCRDPLSSTEDTEDAARNCTTDMMNPAQDESEPRSRTWQFSKTKMWLDAAGRCFFFCFVRPLVASYCLARVVKVVLGGLLWYPPKRRKPRCKFNLVGMCMKGSQCPCFGCPQYCSSSNVGQPAMSSEPCLHVLSQVCASEGRTTGVARPDMYEALQNTYPDRHAV